MYWYDDLRAGFAFHLLYIFLPATILVSLESMDSNQEHRQAFWFLIVNMVAQEY